MAPSGPILQVGRAEVRVGGGEDRLDLGAGEAGALVLELVLQDALEADDVGAPAGCPGSPRGSAGWTGSRCRGRAASAAGRPAAGAACFCGKVEVAGEQRAVIRVGAGAVDDDVLAPAVEDVAVRVGEAVGDVDVELLGARLVAEDAGVGVAHRRAVGRLDLRVMERAFLEVERAARVEDEAVGRVVRVGRVEAVEHADAEVGLAVAVGVLEEHQVGRLGDEDAAVVELEAGRAVQVVGEDGHLSALPSPLVSSKIRILSFISSLGFQCG